jgi:hypothetical protein
MALIEKIKAPGRSVKISRITGNDDSAQHNTTVWVYTDTRDLVLKWRKSVDTEAVPVGIFLLDLRGLLAAGLCERTGKGGNKIRFNIYHDDDRWLRVRVKRRDGGGERLVRLDW